MRWFSRWVITLFATPVGVVVLAAGLLLIEEAGGRVAPYPGVDGLAAGGEVLASTPAIYDRLIKLVKANRRTPDLR